MQKWNWKFTGPGIELSGTTMAVDARDAISKVLTSPFEESLLGTRFRVPIDILQQAQGNLLPGSVEMDGFCVHVNAVEKRS